VLAESPQPVARHKIVTNVAEVFRIIGLPEVVEPCQ
jgi:hypothetical protein